MNIQQGFVDCKGYKTWFEIHGDLSWDATPLLVLHGGPGYPHDYLNPLEALAMHEVPVIFYDQLGCGKSDKPDDSDLWTIELFVQEIDTIRNALGLAKINLFGHSWGGTLALEYIFTDPVGVEKLILSSPLLDTAAWLQETDRLKDLLPGETAAIMRFHEKAGTTDTQEYKDAYQLFVEQFVCRIVPQPSGFSMADKGWSKPVYETMWGSNEAIAIGSLRNYSALSKLDSINVPTLLLSGKYDEATPIQIEKAHRSIKNSEWILLENSSHSGFVEEQEKYLDILLQYILKQH